MTSNNRDRQIGENQPQQGRQISEFSTLPKLAQTLAAIRVLWAEKDGAISIYSSSHPKPKNSPYSPILITHELIDDLYQEIEKHGTPRYRDLNDEILVSLAGKILFDKQAYVPFTLRFSNHLIKRAAKASGKNCFGKVIFETLRRTLKEEFQRSIQFVLVLEGDNSTRLHAHGVLGISPSFRNLLKARRALRRANQEKTKKAIKFSKQSNGVYWCSDYIVKSLDATSNHIRKLSGNQESPVHIDSVTRSEVKNFYEELRAKATPKPIIDQQTCIRQLQQSTTTAREKIKVLVAVEEREWTRQRLLKNPELRHRFKELKDFR